MALYMDTGALGGMVRGLLGVGAIVTVMYLAATHADREKARAGRAERRAAALASPVPRPPRHPGRRVLGAVEQLLDMTFGLVGGIIGGVCLLGILYAVMH